LSASAEILVEISYTTGILGVQNPPEIRGLTLMMMMMMMMMIDDDDDDDDVDGDIINVCWKVGGKASLVNP